MGASREHTAFWIGEGGGKVKEKEHADGLVFSFYLASF